MATVTKLERMAAPQLVLDTRRRGPLSPEELAQLAKKVQEKNNPVVNEPERGLFFELANAGCPVHAATIIGSEIGKLLERIKTLEARLEFLEHHRD
jgi:hypothetical protein